MNDINFIFKGNELIIYNNVNPHFEKEEHIFLNFINFDQLSEAIHQSLIDSIYYYMQQNDMIED